MLIPCRGVFVESGDDHEIETEYGTRQRVVNGIWLRG
jgi:hypothetical protein